MRNNSILSIVLLLSICGYLLIPGCSSGNFNPTGAWVSEGQNPFQIELRSDGTASFADFPIAKFNEQNPKPTFSGSGTWKERKSGYNELVELILTQDDGKRFSIECVKKGASQSLITIGDPDSGDSIILKRKSPDGK